MEKLRSMRTAHDELQDLHTPATTPHTITTQVSIKMHWRCTEKLVECLVMLVYSYKGLDNCRISLWILFPETAVIVVM